MKTTKVRDECWHRLRPAFTLMLLLGAMITQVRAADESAFYGNGLCRFHLDHYAMTLQTEAEINQVVSKALQQHERIFGFTDGPDFHVRIRIFGRFEDYQQFALTNRPANLDRQNSINITNVAGYYSPAGREVVTWRQQQPGYLANNILHECSHAIMAAHFRRMPNWLSEGCAVYFAFPREAQDKNDVNSLKYRWATLYWWLREGKLPALKTMVNQASADWYKMPMSQAYTVSWSLFQLLMSTPQNQAALRKIMLGLQPGSSPPLDCATLIDKEYPGGLQGMEQDWHRWITQTGPKVLGPAMEKILEQVSQREAD